MKETVSKSYHIRKVRELKTKIKLLEYQVTNYGRMLNSTYGFSRTKRVSQAIADGLNSLGWSVDVPNEQGEMKFGPECHEVQTIAQLVVKVI